MIEIENEGVTLYTKGEFDFDKNMLSQIFENNYNVLKPNKYTNVTQFSPQEIQNVSGLQIIYDAIQSKLNLDVNGYNFSKLWLVETNNENVDVSQLPYVPHIDYFRFLKVMVYVDDVTEIDGPFTARPTKSAYFESLRMSLSKNHKKKKENMIDQFNSDEFIMYKAPAGSVLVFDTNCPHMAGKVEVGGHRRVFRFDFEKIEWQRDRGLGTRSIKKLLSFFR
jgi:hypothetical protein